MKHPAPDAINRMTAQWSADIDRQEVFADYESLLAIYRTGVVRRRSPVEREREVAALKSTLQHAGDLLGNYIFKHGAVHLHSQLRTLERLSEEVAKENDPELNAELNQILGFKQSTQLSAIERLVIGLVRLFERHHGAEAGYTETELATGPCVDFVDAGLREASIHYDRHSIVRAMRKARNH